MSFTRRDTLRLAGAASIAPLLAACAGAPPPATESGTFTIYWNAGHDYKAYREVIAEFEKAHQVKVNLQKYQWPDLRTRLLADFSSGTVPDLVEEPGSWVQEFALSGNARSLQDFVDKDGQAMGFPADWLPATVERNSYKGEVYGVQLHLTCQLLFYNKKMFTGAGLEPPTTWAELLTVAKALTGDDVHGIALNQDYTYLWPWLLQAGVRAYDAETGKVMVPREAAAEALRFQAGLVHEHRVSPVPVSSTDYSGPQKLFAAGRAAMIITGPWDIAPIKQTSPDLELGIAPLPSHRERATQLAGTSVFVPLKARRPDLSWDFVKRITTARVEQAVTEEVGMTMPRTSWAKLPEVRQNAELKAFADAFPHAEDPGSDVRLTGHYGEYTDLLKTMYQNIVIRNRPAEQELQRFAEAAEKAIRG
ncbi:ABC transporter substrate-binding protein [Streptosporangium sp. KLBMP 9127]|nr:sugar ABC transporter substrate-binding protein [Streptosporangium sp. KLBMP 9127]